jgi:hypothetical protein
MASFTYWAVWKGIAIDWSERFTFYGKNFNPNVPSLPSWNTFSCYGQTSNFNLTWFQPWNEVWCYIWNIDVQWHWWDNIYVESYIQRYNWGSWSDLWWYTWSGTVDANDALWAWYMYFWVDSDEIWNYDSQYRILTNREVGSQWENWKITNFTVSNLSIDDTLCRPWYLRVEWTNLCYTDATWWDGWHYGYGWKHKINYDTNYNGWSWNPWYMWIPSSSTDRRIYYVDAYWTVRRTQVADERYGGWWYVGTNYAGRMWCPWPYDDMYDWYGYLCYVDGWWYKRRMWNWTP